MQEFNKENYYKQGGSKLLQEIVNMAIERETLVVMKDTIVSIVDNIGNDNEGHAGNRASSDILDDPVQQPQG